MEYSSLSNACKSIFDSYKAVDYVNKSGHSLDKMEWHTWQISILLAFLRVYQEFVIPYEKNIFHEIILNFNNSQIEMEMQKILKKYNDMVNIEKTRDDLSKDVIWTGKEVSIILYSIMNNKKY